jgi:nicotinate-nucleotide adenylyltransferase
LAQAALTQFELDALYVLPTGHAWHKARALSQAQHRLAMTRLAFADLPKVIVDARETQREGATYTVDTLEALQREHAGSQWWLFIGQDQAARFSTWHRWQDLLNLAHLVVAQREEDASLETFEGAQPATMLQSVLKLNLPPIDISATRIRQAVLKAQDTRAWLQPQVAQYIQHHHLYTDHHE